MAQSVKLSDGSYIDASGVYDATQGKTQADINNGIPHIQYYVVNVTTDASGLATLTGTSGKTILFCFASGKIIFKLYSTSVKVFDGSLNPVKGTSVAITCYYV